MEGFLAIAVERQIRIYLCHVYADVLVTIRRVDLCSGGPFPGDFPGPNRAQKMPADKNTDKAELISA